jgi:hypothetical protein
MFLPDLANAYTPSCDYQLFNRKTLTMYAYSPLTHSTHTNSENASYVFWWLFLFMVQFAFLYVFTSYQINVNHIAFSSLILMMFVDTKIRQQVLPLIDNLGLLVILGVKRIFVARN